MKKLLRGFETFRRDVYPRYQGMFRELANGQQPDTMVITCADSRIDPNLLFQSGPGEIFVVRNAGNIAPSYSKDSSGVAASVEYAVTVLKIRHLIICGHSDCGAVKAMLHPEAVASMPALAHWINRARLTRGDSANRIRSANEHERLSVAVQENVVGQLANLMTYPFVAAAVTRGDLELHGCYYDIGAGVLLVLDRQAQAFHEAAAESSASAA